MLYGGVCGMNQRMNENTTAFDFGCDWLKDRSRSDW